MSVKCIVNSFIQGDTPTWGVTVYKTTAKDEVQDTTGWKVWVTLKSDLSLSDEEAELQVSSVTNPTNGALGLLAVKPSIEESNAVDAGRYFYDFQVLTTDGVIQTIESGSVTVKPATTLSSS